MRASWVHFCSAKNFEVGTNVVRVTLPDGRRHRVSITEEPDAFRLTSIVVRAPIVEAIENLPTQVWVRNRGTDLVGFKVDSKNRLIGEAWVPKAGLSAAEFSMYLNAVAAECDRFEYQLTGKDSF